jgi:hypothetical protein
MYNEKIASYLQEIEHSINHIVDCTRPNHETLGGMSLHIQLKELRELFYKLNTNLFLAAPFQLEEEILKAEKIQNNLAELKPNWQDAFLKKKRKNKKNESK